MYISQHNDMQNNAQLILTPNTSFLAKSERSNSREAFIETVDVPLLTATCFDLTELSPPLNFSKQINILLAELIGGMDILSTTYIQGVQSI